MSSALLIVLPDTLEVSPNPLSFTFKNVIDNNYLSALITILTLITILMFYFLFDELVIQVTGIYPK